RRSLASGQLERCVLRRRGGGSRRSRAPGRASGRRGRGRSAACGGTRVQAAHLVLPEGAAPQELPVIDGTALEKNERAGGRLDARLQLAQTRRVHEGREACGLGVVGLL